MAAVNIFVRGDNNGNYDGMTKEEILAAITQAIQSGTISDIDTGFVTKIKELNGGLALRFWVGTTAEYEALTDKPNNVLYIKTDDTSAADINNAITALQTVVASINDTIDGQQTEIEGKAPTNHADTTTKYGAASNVNFGHVKLINSVTTEPSSTEASVYRASAMYDKFTDIYRAIIAVEVPRGNIAISNTITDPDDFAEHMDYGTWSYLGDIMASDGTTTIGHAFLRDA